MDASTDQDIADLWDLIFDIVADVEKRLATHMGAHGLTPPQFYVLKTLMEHDGRCRIGTIAADHHLTNATMTGLVKRLEAMTPALVERARNLEDGRAVDVILTEAGRTRYHAVYASLMRQARAVFDLLPAAEREDAVHKARIYFEILRYQFPPDQVTPAPEDAAEDVT